MNVGIEQAAHLPNVVVNKKSQTRRLPNCFVTFVPFEAASAQDPMSTPVVYNNDNPKWNFVTATSLSAELLDPTEKKFFILKVSVICTDARFYESCLHTWRCLLISKCDCLWFRSGTNLAVRTLEFCQTDV